MSNGLIEVALLGKARFVPNLISSLTDQTIENTICHVRRQHEMIASAAGRELQSLNDGATIHTWGADMKRVRVRFPELKVSAQPLTEAMNQMATSDSA